MSEMIEDEISGDAGSPDGELRKMADLLEERLRGTTMEQPEPGPYHQLAREVLALMKHAKSQCQT